jgi:hypothetical protein
MSVGLSVAGLGFRVHGGAELEEVVRHRYAAFLDENAGGVELQLTPARFNPVYEMVVLPIHWDGSVARFEGGSYDARSRRGEAAGTGLAPVDALIRLAVSTAPLLLLHGAALPGGVALCGASGSGKSTAAAALGGDCDELVAIDGGDLWSTPWWRGRSSRTRLERLICLRKGGASRRSLSGAEAVRELMQHVVRWVSSPAEDRELFSRATTLCARVPVEILDCPVGDGFVPFLTEQLRV